MSYNEKTDGISKEEWQGRLEYFQFKQADMNKLIMNYLVTEGFKEAAEKFQIEACLEPSVELSSLDDRILIRNAVQNGMYLITTHPSPIITRHEGHSRLPPVTQMFCDNETIQRNPFNKLANLGRMRDLPLTFSGRVQEATHLVNQLHPELLDNDRYLFFHLQQLQLIELIRAGKVEEALTFAQTKLSEAGESIPEALSELERTLALLAFEKPQNSPFSDLLEQSHRQKVASELNEAILKMEHHEDSSPKIVYLLKMLLWSQSQLDNRDINYPKMKDLVTALIENK